MKSSRFYASIAIYSKRNMAQEISDYLQITPSTATEKNGIFSWIYSTIDAANCGSLEQHVELLRSTFIGRTSELTALSSAGCEFRVWIYFASGEINQAFVLSPEFIKWISVFDSDIYVDVWSQI